MCVVAIGLGVLRWLGGLRYVSLASLLLLMGFAISAGTLGAIDSSHATAASLQYTSGGWSVRVAARVGAGDGMID